MAIVVEFQSSAGSPTVTRRVAIAQRDRRKLTVALVSAAVAAVLAASLAAAAHAGPAAVKVTLTAPTHAPKIGAKWHYTVRATRAGKPLAGKITAQIVDPIGGVHAVEFGKSTKLITAWPFPGVFADYVIWPPESRGVPLTFRVTVVAGGTRKVIPYKVTPHS